MRFWHVFAILLIISSAMAAVQIFWPTAAETGGGGSFYLGKVAPGHEILIITDRGPKEDPYTNVTVSPDWLDRYQIDGDRMYIYITVPAEVSGSRQFCVELSGEYSSDSFCPSILVTSGLIDFEVQRNVLEGLAGVYLPVATMVKNGSSGETDIEISCSLGEKYCRTVREHVRAGDVIEPEIKIMYPFPGTYDVYVKMRDVRSGQEETRRVQILLRPSLQNNMRVLRWGLPVYFPFALPALSITSVVG